MTGMEPHKDAFAKFLSDSANMKLFQRERLILEVTQLIYRLMEEQRITKSALARRLGKSASFVTQTLDGDRNMTLRTVSDFLTALRRQVHVFDRALTGLPKPETIFFLHEDSLRDTYEWYNPEEHEPVVCSPKAENQVAA